MRHELISCDMCGEIRNNTVVVDLNIQTSHDFRPDEAVALLVKDICPECIGKTFRTAYMAGLVKFEAQPPELHVRPTREASDG